MSEEIRLPFAGYTQTPWKKNLCNQPPTPSEIASFRTPLPSEFPLPSVAGGGYGYFLELHITT